MSLNSCPRVAKLLRLLNTNYITLIHGGRGTEIPNPIENFPWGDNPWI